MIIRSYNFNDNLSVYQIEKECFSNEVRSLAVLEKTSSLDNFIGFVAEENNAIIGYITATYCLDECDIITVAVSNKFRNKGIATSLINALIENLKSKGVTSLFLEVRESNVSAIKLYEKLGFIKLSVRKNYYEGVENAINYLLKI